MPPSCAQTVRCGFPKNLVELETGPCARMCQAHQGCDSPPPDSAKIRCQKVGKSEMGKILVLGLKNLQPFCNDKAGNDIDSAMELPFRSIQCVSDCPAQANRNQELGRKQQGGNILYLHSRMAEQLWCSGFALRTGL